MASVVSRGHCVECDQPATLRQVGRCVYASPCGHRWQGRLEERPAPSAPPVRLLGRVAVVVDPLTGRRKAIYQG